MQQQRPIKNAARGAKRQRQLGPKAACLLCGESDSTLLEEHHVAGRNHDADFTVILCRNCHARLTEAARRVGQELRRARTALHRAHALIQGVGLLAGGLHQSCDRVSTTLTLLMATLDREYPGWQDRVASDPR
jgi:hypothetical protein